MVIQILILIASLTALTFGAEVLVRGSAALAKRLGLSSFFIGLTIVGFGTSTPELATGITAALEGHNDINIGNVVGSNICNIALIMGLTALISPIPVNTQVVRREVLWVIFVAFVPLAAVLNKGLVLRWEGIVMLTLLCVYLWRGYRIGRREGAKAAAAARELDRELGLDKKGWRTNPWVNLLFAAIGIAVLTVASGFLVKSSIFIASALGISELVIALTVIAFGTSAPELVTSLVAAVRKQSDISVGNLLGSNIFNVLGVLSTTAIVKPQHVSAQVLVLDTPVMIVVSLACLPILLTGRSVSRVEGGILLALYVAYTIVVLTVAPLWFGPDGGPPVAEILPGG